MPPLSLSDRGSTFHGVNGRFLAEMSVKWLERWRRRSVAHTVLVSMLLVALVPLLVMAIQGYHCAAMAVVQLQTGHLRSVLEGRKARIEDWIRERRRDISALASYPCAVAACAGGAETATGEDHRVVCDLLDHAHESNDAYESLVVYSLDWKRLNASKRTLHTDDRLIQPHFREALAQATGPIVTAPHFHESGMIGIHLACPIYGDTGNKSGYMVAVFDLAPTVSPILQDRTGLGRTARMYIVSSVGRYHGNPSGEVHQHKKEAPLPEGLLSSLSTEPYTYPDDWGRTVIGAATQLPDLDWVLVAEIERSEAFAWLSSLRRRAGVTGAGALALVLFLALRASQRVTLPLKKLAQVSLEVSGGHFEKRLGPLRGQEPQEVASAFNSMLDELAAAQRELVQAASLAAIGELSSSIVHEMRNPLSSVKMNLKALQSKVADDPTYAELAVIAAGQAERLEQMLNDLLQYGRPLALQRNRLAIADLIDDISITLDGLSKERDVELCCVDHTIGPIVDGDREQLRRAFTNLADNAIRASAAGTSVTLSFALKERDAGTMLVARVDDDGQGISDAIQSRLFEPFFTARGDGTGLGLANVRKIIELHGGTVTGENRPEGGARFEVRIPLGDLS